MKVLGIVVAALMFVACSANQKPAPKSGESDKPLASHGTAEEVQSAANATVLQGKVLERMNAEGYSYLRLSTPSGEIWAAVLMTDVKVGAEIAIENPLPMDGFESKTLKRKFDRIVFGTLGLNSQGSSQTMNLHSVHEGISSSVTTEAINVARAEGSEGRTVAEVYAQKAQLKDRAVAVRGKVVKINANIMSKTWMHLRDGSGDPASGNNDLTVTTQGSAAVGDTVMVKGTVRTDKNLGMGYVFSVIVEDATVVKQ